MDKIVILKQGKAIDFPKTVRVSEEVDEGINRIAIESGLSKARIADILLRKALEITVVVEPQNAEVGDL